jgi:hypothetical protein
MKKIAVFSIFCLFLPFFLSSATAPKSGTLVSGHPIASESFGLSKRSDSKDIEFQVQKLNRVANTGEKVLLGTIITGVFPALLMWVFPNVLTLFAFMGATVLFYAGIIASAILLIGTAVWWIRVKRSLAEINDPETSAEVMARTKKARFLLKLLFPLLLVAMLAHTWISATQGV